MLLLKVQEVNFYRWYNLQGFTLSYSKTRYKIYLLTLQPQFLAQKYTFWSYDPRGKFSLYAKADKLKRYKFLMGFAIYATFHSRAICLRRDMCLRHVSALRAQGRGDLYSRTFHRVRHRRTYRCFAMRNNIALAEKAYRAPKVHITWAKRTQIFVFPWRENRAQHAVIRNDENGTNHSKQFPPSSNTLLFEIKYTF